MMYVVLGLNILNLIAMFTSVISLIVDYGYNVHVIVATIVSMVIVKLINVFLINHAEYIR